MLVGSLTFILFSVLSTAPCRVRAHGYGFGEPVKMNVYPAIETPDIQQILLTESLQPTKTSSSSSSSLLPGTTEPPILDEDDNNIQDDDYYWRESHSAAAEFYSSRALGARAIQAASSTTTNTADRATSNTKSVSAKTTSTTTTSQVKTSVWITITSGATVITTQQYYTQTFDQLYASMYTASSGSIGLGSISGTVGTQRSYLTTEDNAAIRFNSPDRLCIFSSVAAPSLLLLLLTLIF